VINTNLPAILHRLRDIAFEISKIYISLLLLRLNAPKEGFPGTISVKFSVDVTDGQGTKWRRKIAENFNRMRVHERDRRTDGADGR